MYKLFDFIVEKKFFILWIGVAILCGILYFYHNTDPDSKVHFSYGNLEFEGKKNEDMENITYTITGAPDSSLVGKTMVLKNDILYFDNQQYKVSLRKPTLGNDTISISDIVFPNRNHGKISTADIVFPDGNHYTCVENPRAEDKEVSWYSYSDRLAEPDDPKAPIIGLLVFSTIRYQTLASSTTTWSPLVTLLSLLSVLVGNIIYLSAYKRADWTRAVEEFKLEVRYQRHITLGISELDVFAFRAAGIIWICFGIIGIIMSFYTKK